MNSLLSKDEIDFISKDIDKAEQLLANEQNYKKVNEFNTQLDIRYKFKIKDWKRNGTIFIYYDSLTENDYLEDAKAALKHYKEMIEEFRNTGWNAVYNDEKSENKKNSKKAPQINITNNNNNSNTTNIDLNVFENAKLELENACLSDLLNEEVERKIDELSNISKSKERKKEKWTKAKNIFKWAIEQGIQVAGIILPIISQIK